MKSPLVVLSFVFLFQASTVVNADVSKYAVLQEDLISTYLKQTDLLNNNIVTPAENNLASIDQSGEDNLVNINQYGSQNQADIRQFDGLHNIGMTIQNGSGNGASITQTGNNNFGMINQR